MADEQSRESITLQNDPNFDPSSALPGLDLITALAWDGDVKDLFQSQKTDSQKVSQFTPLGSQNSSSGRGNINIDLSDSFHESYHLPSDLGRNSPESWKPHLQSEPNIAPLNHEQYNLGGFDIEFDVDGNLIEFDNDLPQLPLPVNNDQNAQVLREQIMEAGEQIQLASQNREPGVVIMGEQPLPDAEAFPSRKAPAQPNSSPAQSSEDSPTGLVAASRLKRDARKKKAAAMVDASTYLKRKDMRDWQLNYVERMDEIRDRPKATSTSQAKKNALAFLYGGGIANIGAPAIADIDGSAHPLAEDFAGKFFKARILDREVEVDEQQTTPQRRRRGHSEAFAED